MTAGLTPPQRRDLAARIDEERDRTRARLTALRVRLDDIVAAATTDPPDDEHDPEGSTIAYERAQVDALAARALRQLSDLEDARARVVDGTCDACVGCGHAIGFDRLMARPTARLCVTCAAA